MNNNKVQYRVGTMGKDKNTLTVSLRSGSESQTKTLSREDLNQTADHVENFDELLQRMKQMIEDGNARIEAKIDSSNASLVNEMSTLRNEVQQLKTDCVRDFNQLRKSQTNIDDQIQRNKDAVDRASKSNDLLLIGVPYSPAENTNVLVKQMSATLGYTDSDAPPVYTKRLARFPIAVGATPPILLQFAFKASRNDYFLRYLARKNLSLSDLGFEGGKRVFLNENLTKSARNIKGIALKLKRSGHISNVFSKAGIVFVKPMGDVAAQPIFDVTQLTDYGHHT